MGIAAAVVEARVDELLGDVDRGATATLAHGLDRGHATGARHDSALSNTIWHSNAAVESFRELWPYSLVSYATRSLPAASGSG